MENIDAVQKAKELIESGEINNIDKIRAAAENIIDYGI